MIDQTIIEKIQKLLALAGNNPDENEVSSAMAKANEMLAKYNLSMADISQKTGPKKEKGDERTNRDFKYGGYTWQNILWNSVSEMNFCYMFTGTKKTWMKWGREDFRWHTHKYIYIIGKEHNVAATLAMGDYLHNAIEDFCTDWLGGSGKDLKSSRANSWKLGCATRLSQRIREKVAADKEKEKASTSTALVLYKEDEKKNNLGYVNDVMGIRITQKKSSTQVKNESAFRQGYYKGDTVGFNKPLS